MARMRFGIRTTTTTALALAALATPAAAIPTRNQDDRPARVGFAGLRAWSEAKAPQHDSGPVLPLIGKPDFGTAENAFGAARSGHTHEGQDILAPAGHAARRGRRRRDRRDRQRRLAGQLRLPLRPPSATAPTSTCT